MSRPVHAVSLPGGMEALGLHKVLEGKSSKATMPHGDPPATDMQWIVVCNSA